MKSKSRAKEKLVGAAGSLSGITSFFGSYQVCHNLCMSTIALLSIIGITVVGMPLLFLTKVAVPFWLAAAGLLIVTVMAGVQKICVPRKLIIFNSGLMIAGIPFKQVQQFTKLFWLIGGALVILSVILFLKDKISMIVLVKHEEI